MSYYAEHIQDYIESTIGSDMSEVYAMFEPYLPDGALILDVGFGSARDMLYFRGKGYEVRGIDVEDGFVEHAKSLGLVAEKCGVLDYESDARFDGIWACASLLHLQSSELDLAINRLIGFLKPQGVLFISMKEGDGECVDEKGRQMLFANDSTFKPYKVIEAKRTFEQSRDIVWINVIIRGE